MLLLLLLLGTDVQGLQVCWWQQQQLQCGSGGLL
jgi:hypothetical protein